MALGSVYPAEWSESRDPDSGVVVRQLTAYKGHSHHFYFTNSGWYDRGRRLLFGSDRANRTNLFSLDLTSGEITQVSDLEPVPPPYETELLDACVNPVRPEVYFWYARHIVAIDLKDLGLRYLWAVPPGYLTSGLNCTADGQYLCGIIVEDLTNRFRIDLLRGYVGFEETWAAKPHCQIIVVPSAGGKERVAWQERTWLGHINASPTRPNLVTFCHEGPWDKVDNRIWGLDLSGGQPWMIRPRRQGEAVGHEYWHADGEHIGYHGHAADGHSFLGRIRFDNQEAMEFEFASDTGHIHSNDLSLIVGDGGRSIRLWRWNGKGYDGPRLLCRHNSSKHIQQAHPHPRFSPDGKQVLFTSDVSGYCNLYLVDLPAFESLPEIGAGE